MCDAGLAKICHHSVKMIEIANQITLLALLFTGYSFNDERVQGNKLKPFFF